MEIVWNSYGIRMESVWCIRLASPEQRAGNTLLRPLRMTYTSRSKAARDSLSQNGVSAVPCQPPHSTTLARQRTLPNTPNALEANVGLRSGLNSDGAKTRRLTARRWARTDCSPTLPVRGSMLEVQGSLFDVGRSPLQRLRLSRSAGTRARSSRRSKATQVALATGCITTCMTDPATLGRRLASIRQAPGRRPVGKLGKMGLYSPRR
jgi:hypothetical protein